MTPLALAALLVVAPGDALPCGDAAGPPHPGPVDPGLRAHWESATPFADFLASATRRRALWLRNVGEGSLSPAMVERARAVGGTWHLLAVAVDGCSDSANVLPYMGLLAEAVPGLELRVLDPDRGRALMEARRTSDGRAATPTVLLLDAGFDEAGCFIERPGALKAWIAERRDRMGPDEVYAGKMDWYERDAGTSTVDDVVAMLEAAGAGHRGCEAPGR